ncbi:HTH CenpB-type DNA-binding domain [Phaffia rhodozyma]|uniref:HTH CenpB-type DNA-binding domain n=1 Tax=Phaffia rhodozyma TaxID=264483 RepID=A0A0F7STN0_PHARH|nr:HTH CenpB-type DNA-binding domain [Phaffia rhodozyma]
MSTETSSTEDFNQPSLVLPSSREMVSPSDEPFEIEPIPSNHILVPHDDPQLSLEPTDELVAADDQLNCIEHDDPRQDGNVGHIGHVVDVPAIDHEHEQGHDQERNREQEHDREQLEQDVCHQLEVFSPSLGDISGALSLMDNHLEMKEKEELHRTGLTTGDWLIVFDWMDKNPKSNQLRTVEHFKNNPDGPSLIFNQATLSRNLKKRQLIEERAETTHNGRSLKRARKVKFPDVEAALLRWIEEGEYRPTGLRIKERFMAFQIELGVPVEERLKGTNGWLDSFLSTHGLRPKIRLKQEGMLTANTEPSESGKHDGLQPDDHLDLSIDTEAGPSVYDPQDHQHEELQSDEHHHQHDHQQQGHQSHDDQQDPHHQEHELQQDDHPDHTHDGVDDQGLGGFPQFVMDDLQAAPPPIISEAVALSYVDALERRVLEEGDPSTPDSVLESLRRLPPRSTYPASLFGSHQSSLIWNLLPGFSSLASRKHSSSPSFSIQFRFPSIAFRLAMMDTWEIIIIYSILLVVLSLLSFAILFYLPVHVGFLSRRAAYYIKGDESRSIIDTQDFSNLARWIGLLGSASKDDSVVEGLGKVEL